MYLECVILANKTKRINQLILNIKKDPHSILKVKGKNCNVLQLLNILLFAVFLVLPPCKCNIFVLWAVGKTKQDVAKDIILGSGKLC